MTNDLTFTERLLKAAKAHHAVRREQGYATADWDKLEQRNRDEYLAAMEDAIQAFGSRP